MRFEPAEIERASRIVKRAFVQGLVNRQPGGNMTPERIANPHAYNRVADYQNWFHPPSVFAERPPARPGFMSSLGKSTLGAIGRTPVPWYNRQQGFHMKELGLGDAARSFVGLAPGNSGLRNVMGGLADAAGDAVSGNFAGAGRDLRGAFTEGLAAPARRAAQQSRGYHGAVSDWLTGVDMGTRPGRRLKPGEYPGALSQDMQQALLHPIQTWRNRPDTGY